MLVARRGDRLARLSAELGGDEAALPITLDLARPDASETLARAMEERGLRVRLLVNNAGLGAHGRVHEQPLDKLRAMVDVDVRAVLELTRAFVPAMVERRSGAVINVVSMSAFQPVPFLAVYAASKAFVLSMTEALATELAGTGVTVQALCPGLVRTEFQEVAGTSEVRFNRVPPMSAARVAAISLDALPSGKVVVIPGIGDRVTVAAQRFVPRGLVRRVAAELFRPPTRGGSHA